MKYCIKCGAELKKGASFCIKCGNKIEGGNGASGEAKSTPVSTEEKPKVARLIVLAVFMLAVVLGLSVVLMQSFSYGDDGDEVKHYSKESVEEEMADEDKEDKKGIVEEVEAEVADSDDKSDAAKDEAVENKEDSVSDETEEVESDEDADAEMGLSPDIIKAYRNRIQSFLDNETYICVPYEVIRKEEMGDWGEVYFSLKDLNNDGIEELLLINGSGDYDDAANVFFGDDDLSKTSCEALVSYYDEENDICYYNDSVDLNTITVFRLNGDEKIVLEKYETDTIDDFETFVYYYIDASGNRTEVSEVEYKVIEDKIPRKDAFEKYEINEENLDKYLPVK